jgi:hypothetical protein
MLELVSNISTRFERHSTAAEHRHLLAERQRVDDITLLALRRGEVTAD